MQTSPSAHYRLEFDPQLMEEAVMLSMPGHPQEADFRQARDAIYLLKDPEEKDAQFNQLHRYWFTRLDLGQQVLKALQEQPALMQGTRGCYVPFVPLRKAEGADLHGAFPSTIVLKLRPTSLLADSSLPGFLRHEFMHLADILDPCFAYETDFPTSEIGPTHDNLIHERYRVLWDAWIDGRLLGRGWTTEEVVHNRLLEFQATFPMLGKRSEAVFSAWSKSPLHTHNDLLSFARDPESADPDRPAEQSRTGRCPLCRFPSFELRYGPDLPPEAVREIEADFPDWKPAQGACPQCNDLYQARQMSREAVAQLPSA
jgi:hypothetical protein